MTLPASGPISLLNLQDEFGGTNPIAINEYYRGGANVSSALAQIPASGQVDLNIFHGISTALSQGAKMIKLHAAGNQIYYVANGAWISFHDTQALIYRSADLKTSVTDTTVPPPNSYVIGFDKFDATNLLTCSDGSLVTPFSNKTTQTRMLIGRSIDNGANWTVAASDQEFGWSYAHGVSGTLYGSSVLCFLQGARAFYSADGGASWQYVTSTGTNNATALAFCPGLAPAQGGDGLFVASRTYGLVDCSPDGKIWTSCNVYDSVTGSIVVLSYNTIHTNGVAAGQGIVVFISNLGRPIRNDDSTATRFTMYPALQNGHTSAMAGKVAYGNGYFAIVGKTSLAAPNDVGIWTSVDGISWTFNSQIGLTGLTPFKMDYHNGKFYVQMTDGSAWAANA